MYKNILKSIKEDKIAGGLADKKTPKDFDQKKLAEGLKVEMEHTSDKAVAKEIAMDHLTEDSEYYKKLKTIEKTQKTYSEQQIADMVVELLLKKSKEYPDVSTQSLSKGFGDAFKTGLTVLGLIHGADALYQQQPSKKITPQEKISQQKEIEQARSGARKQGEDILSGKSKKDRQAKIDNFLKAVSMNESSGGKNLNHKKMTRGIHAGDSAIGEYAFMPNTVKNIANTLDEKHPLRNYSKMSNQKIQQQLSKNPQHQKELATHLANKLHDRFGGDENKMSYSWNQGHNLQPSHFENQHKDYLNHDYVKKYNQNKQPSSQPKIDNKKQKTFTSNSSD